MNVPHKKNRPRGGLLILIGVCLFLMLLSSFSPSFNSIQILNQKIHTLQSR